MDLRKKYMGGMDKKATEKRKAEEDKQKKKLKSHSSSTAVKQPDVNDDQPGTGCEAMKEWLQ